MGFVSHIDFRVRDAASVAPLYDALFAALGMREGLTRTALKAYARWNADGVRVEWFNIFEEPACAASATRIALRAESRAQVDRVFHAIQSLAKNLEGPELIERTGQYAMSYYGLFFEDALGNKFEVCHCVMTR